MNVQTKKTGRPPKYGLCWLKLDVNFTEDFRIMKLSDKYGPNGVMIFINLICLVYREGYYLEEPMEMLALAVMRRIGSKWLESVEYVCEVIRYCAGIGLFDDDLLKEEVLTSVGIQRRYGEICSRRKADRSMYWLLQKEKDDDPAAERRVSAAKSAQEKEKEKEEDKEKEKEKEKPTASPPTLSQVKAFCEKEGLSVDPEKFCNYYDSFGWKKNFTLPCS